MEHVEVTFLGPLRRPAGLGQQARLKLPQPRPTVAALLEELGYSPDERAHLRVMIEGRPVPPEQDLEPGQKLTIFLPLGGG